MGDVSYYNNTSINFNSIIDQLLLGTQFETETQIQVRAKAGNIYSWSVVAGFLGK